MHQYDSVLRQWYEVLFFSPNSRWKDPPYGLFPIQGGSRSALPNFILIQGSANL